jgi:60 kDa SS-A/Ro ribonucleoprotein
MAKFAVKPGVVERLMRSPQAAINYEGGLAFVRDPRRTLVKMAACCLVNERSFYEDTTGKVFALVKEVGAVDPKWLVRLAVFLREELRMRSVVHYIAAVCLTLPEARSSIARAFPRIAPRADDMLEIAALLKDERFGLAASLPHVARRLFAARLNGLSEYEIIKYRRRSRFGLRHLLGMVHPKPVSRKQEMLFRYVLSGGSVFEKPPVADPELIPQIFGYEQFKSLRRGHIRKICALIEEGRLPWEVAVPAAGSRRAVWTACAKSMPIMALIRNLRNLHKSKALKDPEVRKIILDKLTDPEVIFNSKQLPFRWLSAHRAIADDDPEIGEALLGALELSLVNLPRFSGTTFISCDNSGSMYWTPLSARSRLVPADIANLLGAMIFHLSDAGLVSVFADEFAWVPLTRGDRIMANWKKLQATDVGGATYAYKAIQYLLKDRIFVDRIIIPTDMIIYSNHDLVRIAGSSQEYQSRIGSIGRLTRDSESFLVQLRHYRRRINPRVKTYIINLQPYEYFIAPDGEEGITTISGWSEAVLKYIEHDSAVDGSDMVDIVGRVRL